MLMDLYIETLTGVSFELRVSPAETVMSIKSKIQRAEGIPITQQHLIWRNGELADHRRLRDYSISGGSTIRLVLGLCGGPLSAHRVPPLRLAPLHMPTPNSSVLSRRISTNRGSVQPPNLKLRNQSYCSKPIQGSVRSSLMDNSSQNSQNILNDHFENKTGVTLTDVLQETSASTSAVYPTGPNSASIIHDVPEIMNSENSGDKPQIPSTQETDTAIASILHPSNTDKKELELEELPPIVDGTIPSSAYPPLFPDGPSRLLSSCHDISSFWRLYEPHTLSTLSKALLIRNSYQLVSTTDHDADSTPPGSAGDRESHIFSTAGKREVDESTEIDPDGGFPFSGSTNSASTTTLLAGLLSTTGDQVDISCQTGGGDGFLSHSRQFYHGFHKAPSFLEDLEFARRNRIAALLWNSDELASENDRVVCNPFDIDTEHEDDPDDGEGGSTAMKDDYNFDVDDDDSLADLEEYMFYYRTGDLLVGPPSLTAVYPSYSYYTVYDCHPSDIEPDLGLYPAHSVKEDLATHTNCSTWQEERSKMAAKVTELKNRMRELRIRRQSRQRTRTNTVNNNEQAHDATDNLVSSAAISDSSHYTPSTLNCRSSSALTSSQGNLQNLPDTSDAATVNACKSSSFSKYDAEQKQRRRRVGTIIPPDPDFLTQPDSSISTYRNCNSKATDANSSPYCPLNPFLLTSLSPRSWIRRPSTLFRPKSTSSIYCASENVIKVRPSTCVAGRNSPLSLSSSLFQLQSVSCSKTSESADKRKNFQERKSKAPLQLPKLIVSGALPEFAIGCRPKEEETRTTLPPISCSVNSAVLPRSPAKQPRSPTSPGKKKRCALCLRKIGIATSYSCRCGRSFCSRHRYAETHSCPFDYKAEARRALVEANPVVTAPKLPKI